MFPRLRTVPILEYTLYYMAILHVYYTCTGVHMYVHMYIAILRVLNIDIAICTWVATRVHSSTIWFVSMISLTGICNIAIL